MSVYYYSLLQNTVGSILEIRIVGQVGNLEWEWAGFDTVVLRELLFHDWI